MIFHLIFDALGSFMFNLLQIILFFISAIQFRGIFIGFEHDDKVLELGAGSARWAHVADVRVLRGFLLCPAALLLLSLPLLLVLHILEVRCALWRGGERRESVASAAGVG